MPHVSPLQALHLASRRVRLRSPYHCSSCCSFSNTEPFYEVRFHGIAAHVGAAPKHDAEVRPHHGLTLV